MKTVPIDDLKAVLEYDPETGIFRWLVACGRMLPGQVAGTLQANGYVAIGLFKRRFFAHRLAWLYVHGTLPARLDHINGIPSDNRIANLRPASPTQNNANALMQSRAVVLPGVRRLAHGNRFRAQIVVNRKHRNLGTFATAAEAHAAYVRAHIATFGEFSKFSKRAAATAVSAS